MSCTRSKAGFRGSIKRMGGFINHLPFALVCTPRLVLSGVHSLTICRARTILGPSLFRRRGRKVRTWPFSIDRQEFNQQPQGGAVVSGVALSYLSTGWVPSSCASESDASLTENDGCPPNV